MKKILITGATGFIGSYLLQTDRNHSFIPFSFQHDHISQFDFHQIDTIVHLAALVHQMEGASTEAYFKINTERTLELATKAKQKGVKHFIFMSTVKVYGEENHIAYTEESPCNPQDDYGKSKLAAEKGLLSLADRNFIVSIIRTPIVYGYGVKANIENLLKLIEKISILPFKDTHNQRSMVYIGNIYALIQVLLENPLQGIFLASDDHSLSTSEFIRLIAHISKKQCLLVNIPFFETFLKVIKPMYYQRLFGSLTVDNTYTKTLLHFQNPYTIEEGIQYMIYGENNS